MKNYIKTGFRLINQNIWLYGINAFLSILSYVLGHGPLEKNFFVVVIGIAIILIGLAFSFSLPVFFQILHNHKSLDLSFIRQTTLQNTKRLILPSVGFYFVVSFFFLIMTLGLKIPQINATRLMSIIFWFGSIFLLSFSFFFSVKKEGVIKSFLKSINYTSRHGEMLFLGLIVSSVSVIPAVFFPANQFTSFVYNFGSVYLWYWFLASAYLFWQDHPE